MEIPNPEELGKVNWLRDYDEAIALAKAKNRPVLILFQEVPGCSTCKGFGKEALSHPLIVDAIENEFIPLAIHNNKSGKDAEVLKSFNEAAWNNPVVRIINSERKELCPRIANYQSTTLVKSMNTALHNFEQFVPQYLSLLSIDLQAEDSHKESATYAMDCFWTGEALLGELEGVLSTKAGKMDSHEVVTVSYDPEVIDYKSLTLQAQSLKCDSKVYYRNDTQKEIAETLVGKDKIKAVSTFRLDDDPKYYISKSSYKYVPMLSVQASRVNALLGKKRNPDHLLSPTQLRMYEFIEKYPALKWKNQVIANNFNASWEKVETQIANAVKAFAHQQRNGRR